MADDKKKDAMTLAKATNISEWVDGYYGDDAIDHSKANKLRHIIRTSQFAAVAFMVSKNTKQAHTDFFESNYTALDLTYAKATSLIIRLLSIKYGEDRPLTKADFQKCGGDDLFKGRPNFDEICNDYIGAGGMVEQAEVSFPKPDPKELLEPGETLDDYKLLPTSEKNRRVGVKMALLYGSFAKDLESVAADHAQLVKLSGSDSGVLSAKDAMELLDKATDKGSSMQREWKGKKSAIDFTIRDDIEKSYELGYDLAKQTGKVAVLGGMTAASLGAVVGGVFWPAFMLIPAYALAKKWLPDWMKSLGSMWGHVEKSIGNRFKRQRYDSYYHYIVSFMETGGKPKLRFKDRFFLTPGVIKTLKKGAKSGAVTSTYEGTDGELHESELFRAKRTLEQTSFSNLLNATDDDKLVPADKQALLFDGVKKIDASKATISNFAELANKYNTWKDGLPRDAKHGFPIMFGDKLNESVVKVIFDTSMEDIKYVTDVVNVAFADEGAIIGVIKETDPAHPVLPKIARLKAFANKEITGLNESWKGKTLREYIERDGLAKLGDAELTGFSTAHGADVNLDNAINWIKNLERDPKDERAVVVRGTNIGLSQINKTIALISDSGDKKRCNDFLDEQIKVVFYNELRQDAKATLTALTDGSFTGKMADLSKFFDEMNKLSYDNVDTMDFSQLVFNVTGETKISPPEVGSYLRVKLSQTAREKFIVYLNQGNKAEEFTDNMEELIKFLRKVNNCKLLNEQQKAELSSKANIYVSKAFDKFVKNMSGDFVGKYDGDKIRQYLEDDYAGGGLKTLFRTNNSATVKGVENGLYSLNTSFADIQSNLKFNGKNMSAKDRAIISRILLRDESSGFDEVKVRDSSDGLVKFLATDLKVSKIYEKSKLSGETSSTIGNVIKGTSANPTPYYELQQKFSQIDLLSSDYDKYAAIVALKNKAITEFRQCLSTVAYTFGPSHGNISNWLTTADGIDMYDAVISAWSSGDDSLFVKIDKKLEEIHGTLDPKLGIKRSALFSEEEARRYTGTYTLDLSNEAELGK